MAIKLYGVDYPDMDTTVRVPEKIITTSIDNSVKVPNLGGNKVNDDKIEITPIEAPYIYKYLEIPNPQTNGKDWDISKPELVGNKVITDLYTPTITKKEKDVRYSGLETTILIPWYSNNRWGITDFNINFKVPIEKLEYQPTIKNYTVNDIVDSFVPNFSDEYKQTISQVRFDLYSKPVTKETENLNGILGKFSNIVNKGLFSIKKKSNDLIDAIANIGEDTQSNRNLYGEIPQGWFSSMGAKVRWEAVDWQQIDPNLAANGIIKLGNKTLRPDLILSKTNTKEYTLSKTPKINRHESSYMSAPTLLYDTDKLSALKLLDKGGYSYYNGEKVIDPASYIFYAGPKKEIYNPKNADNVVKYYESVFTRIRKSPMYQMLLSGADFLDNMFDIAIVLHSRNGNNFSTLSDFLSDLPIKPDSTQNSNIPWMEDYDTQNKKILLGDSIANLTYKTIENGSRDSIFLIRTSSIEIPQMENEIFNIKWLGSENIAKVKSRVNYNRKSNLKITLDEPLYTRLLFNIFSGTNRSVLGSIFYKNQNSDKYYPGNISLNSLYTIDILVKHESLLNTPYLEDMKTQWRVANIKAKEGEPGITNIAELRGGEYPVWWFKDVKFLGEGSELQFSRENTSVTELTFPFLFKYCTKVDRSILHKDTGEGESSILELENLFVSHKGKADDESGDIKIVDRINRLVNHQGFQEWLKPIQE